MDKSRLLTAFGFKKISPRARKILAKRDPT